MREGLAAVLTRARRRGRRDRRARGVLALCCAASGLALLLAACGPTDGPSAAGDTPVSGGTATWAESPSSQPTWIFPFAPSAYFSVANTDDFEYLMYRPLYWFGTGTKPTLNTQLSLADPPTYHGRLVTIKLKDNYRWSNGEPVDAQDVLFWIHMEQADAALSSATKPVGWGGYIPGYFPNNVKDIKAVGTYEITMVMKSSYSTAWFTGNELSQITPMPMAWDRTSTGKSDCAAVVADCTAVYDYLYGQSTDTASYATSKIWSVVDGPWRLTSFSTSGLDTFSYNTHYSGQVPAHHISKFTEVPFISEQSEYTVLQAGGSGGLSSQKLDVGYLPTVDAPPPAAGAQLGQNPLPGYHLSALYEWGLSYYPYNFRNNTYRRFVFSQLYFRKAFQHLVDQEGVINGPLHGYGKVTTGPVGNYPVTKYLSPKLRKAGDPFALSLGAARRLLTSHGWTIPASGPATCTKPGPASNECGTGIKAGDKLTFSMIYASGIDWMESAVKELVSNASLVGIDISATAEGFDTLITQVVNCTATAAANCGWQLADWGSWTYAPDYLPTGEELFQTTSVANFGGYSNARNNQLISKTLHSSGLGTLYAWQNYLAGQLPVVWTPDAPADLLETADSLHIGPQASTLAITPEDWYFLK